jgi:hypothetical protein
MRRKEKFAMKKICVYLETVLLIIAMSACTNQTKEIMEVSKNAAEEETDDGLHIEVMIDDQTYTAVLYDNETAHELAARLPLTLSMESLHDNEVYYFFDKGFPMNESYPSSIQTGDLMLYGSDCLVLFYEDFTPTYRYTPIGRLEHAEDLATFLKNGSTEVRFIKK